MGNLSTSTFTNLTTALGSRASARELDAYLGGPSPEAFGGDPTGVADSSAAFTAALAASGHVHIPAGHTYKIGTGLVLTIGQSIIGRGKTSKITYVGTGAAITYDDQVLLRDFYLEGSTSGVGGTVGSIGLKAGSTNPTDFDGNQNFSGLFVSYFGSGIQVNYNGILKLDCCLVEQCTNGLHFTVSQLNAITVVGGEFKNNVNGVLDDSTGGTYTQTFLGVTIEGNTAYGYKRTAGGTSNLNLLGCYFEANVTGDIFVDSPGLLYNFQILGCSFRSTPIAIDIEDGIAGTIDYCNFTDHTTEIRLGAGTKYVKVGNGNQFDASFSVVNSGYMNDVLSGPQAFGVDASGAADSTDELIAWIAANPDKPHLPPGVYKISASITLPSNCHLSGSGPANTILFPANGFVGPLIILGDDTKVSDIEFQGLSAASSVAIKPGTAKSRWTVERCWIRLFADGMIDDTSSTNGTIRDCHFSANTATGLKVTSTATNLTVEGCYFASQPRNIHITGGVVAMSIRDCIVILGSAHGIECTGYTLGLMIDGCYFDSNTGYDLYLNVVYMYGISIRGNRFVTTATSIFIYACEGTVIEGNVFQPGTTAINVSDPLAVRTTIGENTYLAGQFVYATHNSGTQTSYRGQIFSNATPTGGTWQIGEVVWDPSPVSGQPAFRVCSVAGTPGTWIAGPNLA